MYGFVLWFKHIFEFVSLSGVFVFHQLAFSQLFKAHRHRANRDFNAFADLFGSKPFVLIFLQKVIDFLLSHIGKGNRKRYISLWVVYLKSHRLLRLFTNSLEKADI